MIISNGPDQDSTTPNPIIIDPSKLPSKPRVLVAAFDVERNTFYLNWLVTNNGGSKIEEVEVSFLELESGVERVSKKSNNLKTLSSSLTLNLLHILFFHKDYQIEGDNTFLTDDKLKLGASVLSIKLKNSFGYSEQSDSVQLTLINVGPGQDLSTQAPISDPSLIPSRPELTQAFYISQFRSLQLRWLLEGNGGSSLTQITVSFLTYGVNGLTNKFERSIFNFIFEYFFLYKYNFILSILTEQ